MFIREIKKKRKKDGKEYEYVYHRLVASVRTPSGPRQYAILDLGTLPLPKEKHKDLANIIEAFVNKDTQVSFFSDDPELIGFAKHFADVIIQKRLQEARSNHENDDSIEREPCAPGYKTQSAVPAQAAPPRNEDAAFETIDVNSITSSCGRTVGPEHIALEQLKQIGFFGALEELSFSKRRQNYAAAQICARVVHPSSERESARWLRDSSGLDELLNADFSRLSDHTLHRIGDALLVNKEKLEARLSQNTRELFSLDETLILYDLTNSYFESPKRGSAVAAYGRSKEKRSDCPLITLALVVDGHGFPKHSRIYKGNVSEPGTLWEILDEMNIHTSYANTAARTIVIDAGIATEENLEQLRADERFEYVAISRRKQCDETLFAQAPAQKLEINRHKELTVKKAQQGDEVFLLCESPDRAAKEEAIFSRRRERFEKGLRALQKGLKKPRTKKDYASVLERIGRLKERHKVGHFYAIEVEKDQEKATDIKWNFLSGKKRAPGKYIIRTSRKDLSEGDLSMLHRTLTMIESAFRWLKSELGMRPNYHQLDKRMKAHVFVSVLAYYVLAPILRKLEWGGKFVGMNETREDHAPWAEPYGLSGLMNEMSSQTRVTTSFKCQDGKRMDVRTTLEPTTKQREIYRRLKMNPQPLKRVIAKPEK